MSDHSTEQRPEPNFIVRTELSLFEPRPELILLQIRSREQHPTSSPQWHTSIADEFGPQEYHSLFVLQAGQAEELARHLLNVAADSRDSSSSSPNH